MFELRFKLFAIEVNSTNKVLYNGMCGHCC